MEPVLYQHGELSHAVPVYDLQVALAVMNSWVFSK